MAPTLTAPDKYMKIGGKRYGVVFEVSNYAMVYNTALFKGKPPADFNEFLAAAKAATGNGNFGYAYRATMAERGGMWYDLCNYVYGFGGRWSDESRQSDTQQPEGHRGRRRLQEGLRRRRDSQGRRCLHLPPHVRRRQGRHGDRQRRRCVQPRDPGKAPEMAAATVVLPDARAGR